MSWIKRKLQRKMERNNFNPALLREVETELDLIEKLLKPSDVYKELRKRFVERGFKPFEVMTYYQAAKLLKTNPNMDSNEAYEIGKKIAAKIANRKRK